MKFFQTLIFLSILFAISLPSFSQDEVLAKDVLLATVNGEPVTLLDVLAQTLKEEKQLALIFSGKNLEEKRKKMRDSALELIVERKLVYEKFKKMGYKLPKQIIETMLDQLASDLAGGNRQLLESKARKAGLSMDELREQAIERAATGILINERCFKNVYITPKQVHDYYQENKAKFNKKPRLKLQLLYLKCNPGNQTMANFAEKLNKLLKNADNKTFGGYVRLHSQGPNKESGGDVGWIGEDKLRKEFSSLLIGKRAGTIAGPIMTVEGYYFIRISDREEAQTPAISELKEEIRKKLSEKEEEKCYNAYIERLKKGALIRIVKNPSE